MCWVHTLKLAVPAAASIVYWISNDTWPLQSSRLPVLLSLSACVCVCVCVCHFFAVYTAWCCVLLLLFILMPSVLCVKYARNWTHCFQAANALGVWHTKDLDEFPNLVTHSPLTGILNKVWVANNTKTHSLIVHRLSHVSSMCKFIHLKFVTWIKLGQVPA